MRRPRVVLLILLTLGTVPKAGSVFHFGSQVATAVGAATDAEARAACTPCHLFPPPDILPKIAWREEIARMSLIRSNVPQPLSATGAASRMIPLPPDFERVLKY